jgi:cyclophilin family peptidyl-prolyl cis-trans isomerase
VFGKVISGLDILKKIETTPTNAQDRPNPPVQMIQIKVNDQ